MNRISKKPFLALIAVFVVALVAAGCGDKSSSSASPQDAMKAALAKTATITSGTAKIKGSVSIGNLPGSLSVTGGGSFDTKAADGGALDLDFALQIAGTEQKFGFTTVDGASYLTVGDKALEQKDGNKLTTGQISDFIEGLSKYLTNVKSIGDSRYSADVNVKQMIADNKNGDLGKLSIPGIGSGAELQKSLGKATVTVTVDAEGYAQTMDINLSLLQSGGNQGGVRATISLEDINQPVTISKPENIVESASDLGAIGAALAGQ